MDTGKVMNRWRWGDGRVGSGGSRIDRNEIVLGMGIGVIGVASIGESRLGFGSKNR